MARFELRTLSQLQDKVLHEPARLPALLDFLTVQVSEMFRDPAYFRALREKVVPLLRTYPSLKVWVAGCSTGEEAYSLAILLREEGLLARTLIYATDINPQALQKAEAGVYDVDRIAGFTENHRAVRRALVAVGLLHGRLRPRGLRQVAASSTSCSPTTAWPPTACSPRCSWCRAATCSSTSTANCRIAPSGLFREALCRKGFLGIGAKESLRFSSHADAFAEFVREDRIYQKRDAA